MQIFHIQVYIAFEKLQSQYNIILPKQVLPKHSVHDHPYIERNQFFHVVDHVQLCHIFFLNTETLPNPIVNRKGTIHVITIIITDE